MSIKEILDFDIYMTARGSGSSVYDMKRWHNLYKTTRAFYMIKKEILFFATNFTLH